MFDNIDYIKLYESNNTGRAKNMKAINKQSHTCTPSWYISAKRSFSSFSLPSFNYNIDTIQRGGELL